MNLLQKKVAAIALILLIAAQPLSVSAENTYAETGTRYEVANDYGNGFINAFKQAKDGDEIHISGNVSVGISSAGDPAFVIDKQIKISGNSQQDCLTFRNAGIILGKNVTFENMTLELANPVRNAVFANGYKLTMNHVNFISGKANGDIFCGGITHYTEDDLLPESGTNGEVLVNGGRIKNIYAGSLVDTPTDGAETNLFNGSASITVTGEYNTADDIFAGGARENRDGGAANEMIPDNQRYRVAGNVTIQLCDTAVKNVYGNPIDNKTYVIWAGGEYPVDSIVFSDLAGLNVKTGKLGPKARNSNAQAIGSLGISAGGQLDLSQYGSGVEVSDFEGGGDLILGKQQHLKITGRVSGMTSVAIGGLFRGKSLQLPDKNAIYIKAKNSTDDSFKLYPYNQEKFTRNSDGEWSAVSSDSGEDTVIYPIFYPKDESKIEQFKAEIFNGLLYHEEVVDVSRIQIRPEEITYTGAMTVTGEWAVRFIVRTHPFFSTITLDDRSANLPVFEMEDGYIKNVKFTYADTWTDAFIKKAIAGYDDAMSRIEEEDSDFAKALKLHDWIVKNVSYSQKAQYNGFGGGALAERKAVCAGYAQCYQFLLEQQGIENIYIAAQTSSEPHAWNLVKIKNHYFHVDCTWDRGVGPNPGVNHTYFMLNDAEFNADGAHTEDWKAPSKGYPSKNLCSIENKFYRNYNTVVPNEVIAENPIKIQHACAASFYTKPEATVENACGERLLPTRQKYYLILQGEEDAVTVQCEHAGVQIDAVPEKEKTWEITVSSNFNGQKWDDDYGFFDNVNFQIYDSQGTPYKSVSAEVYEQKRPWKMGNVTGIDERIDAADALYLRRAVSEWTGYHVPKLIADANGDGGIEIGDVIVLERCIAGWREYQQLPYKSRK